MKVDQLVFETVGCCETHTQAKVEKDDISYHITPVGDVYNLAVYNKDGLLSRHNLLSGEQLESMLP